MTGERERGREKERERERIGLKNKRFSELNDEREEHSE
jgi:hypothetical protein